MPTEQNPRETQARRGAQSLSVEDTDRDEHRARGTKRNADALESSPAPPPNQEDRGVSRIMPSERDHGEPNDSPRANAMSEQNRNTASSGVLAPASSARVGLVPDGSAPSNSSTREKPLYTHRQLMPPIGSFPPENTSSPRVLVAIAPHRGDALVRCPKCGTHRKTSISPFSKCTSSRSVFDICAGAMIKCSCCLKPIDIGISVEVNSSCDHLYCSKCYNHRWETALNDGIVYPPHCCRTSIPMYTNVLAPHLVARHHEKNEEFTAREPIYCASRGCGKFLGDGHNTEKTPRCRPCNTHTCTSCYQLMTLHTDHARCPERTNDDLCIDGEKVLRCPKCATPGEILVDEMEEGCNTLTCTGCQTRFCAECGEYQEDGDYCISCEDDFDGLYEDDDEGEDDDDDDDADSAGIDGHEGQS